MTNGGEWLPMQHRAFWDIPRMAVVEFENETFLFDCPFDDELDDYPDFFTLYKINVAVPPSDSNASWEHLSDGAEVIGRVPTKDVRFDPTRRRAIATETLVEMLKGRDRG